MTTRLIATSEQAQTDQLHDFFPSTSDVLSSQHLPETIESTYQQLPIPWNPDRTARKVDAPTNRYRRLNADNSDREGAELSSNGSPQQQTRRCESPAPRCESPIFERKTGSEDVDELSLNDGARPHCESQAAIEEGGSDFLGEKHLSEPTESSYLQLPIPWNPERTTRQVDAPTNRYRRLNADNSYGQEAELSSNDSPEQQIERSGSTILIRSEENEGTTCNFALPPAGLDPRVDLSVDSNSSVNSIEGDRDREYTSINPEDDRIDEMAAAFFHLHQGDFPVVKKADRKIINA